LDESQAEPEEQARSGAGETTQTVTSAKNSMESGLPASEGAKSRTSQGAEHTDSAHEQKDGHYPAAHQKSQEQQQELLPAESSAGQEGTASAPVELTTRDVDPASSSN